MNVPRRLLASLLLLPLFVACAGGESQTVVGTQPNSQAVSDQTSSDPMPSKPNPSPNSPTAVTTEQVTQPTTDPVASATEPQLATFGGGCFWCTEAVLEQLDGVLDVTSGYMGGTVDDPSYQQICTGTTGHAEVVQVRFDAQRITYQTLLDWFFQSHDPTTLNRQGADVGTQYRSVVFTHSAAQREAAQAKIRTLAEKFGKPVVTELSEVSKFWPAEAYHQDYFRGNQKQGYCRSVIAPKLEKLGLDSAPAK